MEIVFKSKKLHKVFNDSSSLIKKYGNKHARKIVQRLNEFNAANSLYDIVILQAPRLHSLKGKMHGYWAVDLIHPFRLVIEPMDGETTDLKTVTEIKIIEVIDYH
jgi:proteic killer suppression protein